MTPNWSFLLPGAEYQGDAPDGFMPRDEVIATLERYVTDHGLPVRCGVRVKLVEPPAARPSYLVRTDQGDYAAANVVVATGLFQRPKIPAFATSLPSQVLQFHSGDYRNPAGLPPGAVLVVGSGQSGCHIAEELYRSGRRVYLSIGRAGRAPRRYRGRDIYRWVELIGFLDRTTDQLPSPQARFMANPQVSGAGGGHDVNLHQFARDGVTLLGHLQGSDEGTLVLAPDHRESLAISDGFEAMLLGMIDEYIAAHALDAPGERPPVLRDGYDTPVVTELSLTQAGIRSLIWAAGYSFDFDLVRLPVTDGDGFPITQCGVAAHEGLYFAGLPWLPAQKTGLFMGVGEQARHVAAHIAGRMS